jgi:phage-related protein
LLYKEADGSVPVKEWLEQLRRKDRKAFAKCVERIQRLAALGHELRRPHADVLHAGIYELRARHRNVNYRILYFFHGKDIAVLAHGLTKEGRMSDADMDRAVKRKLALELNPERHIHEEDDHGKEEDH